MRFWKKPSENNVFDQEGLVNCHSIIENYINNNEMGLALEHLLYVIFETEIRFPINEKVELNNVAKSMGLNAY